MPPVDPLAAEPLLRTLRAAHPDVDIVVLPTPSPAAVEAATLPDDPSHESAASPATADRCRQALNPAGTPSRRIGWWHGALDDTVQPVVTDRFDAPGSATPDRVLTALTDDGWSARLVSTERFPRLHAGSAGHQVRIVWLDDAILLTVRGLAVSVDAATARRLLTGRVDSDG